MTSTLRTHGQAVLILLLAAFVITPFALLCCHAHPSADDWYMAATGRDLGLLGASVKWYQEMTGRIVQQGITSLHPIRLGVWAYQLWCLGFLIGLGAGLHRVIRAWLPELDRTQRAVFTALSLILALWAMRSPAQGLYWVNGGNTYLLAGILQMFMLAALAQPAKPSTHVIVALLAATAVWCSELAMGLQLLCLLLIASAHWLEHRRLPALVLTALAATAVAAAVIFLSPGNDWRAGVYHNKVQGQLLPALLLSAKLAVSHLLVWLTTAPYFLLSILLLALWPVRQATTRQACLRIALALVLMVGTTWGGFFIGAWSMGQSLPPRAVNLLGLFFLLEWGLLIEGSATLLRARQWPRPVLSPALFFLLLLTLGASLRAPNPVKSAWRDFLSGDAAQFDLECQQRDALIRAATTDEVTVPPLRVKPVSLFFNDLHSDSTDWRNAGMATFYRKKAIHLSP